MKAYLIGIDVGTSSVKALLCSTSGKIIAEAQASYPLISPRAGWNEQEPRHWWPAVVKSVRSVCQKAGVPRGSDRVRGIGLSGQMHGSVFLDSRDQVIRPALLWNDQRTTEECEEILVRAGGQKALIEFTQNTVLTGFTAPKVLWLRNHEPKNFKRLKTLLLPKDYVRLELTGEKATDVSDASGTALFDVRARKWSKPLVDRLELDPAILPRLHESSEVAGRLRVSAARELGLRAGIPVVAGAGDQPAAAVGMGVVRAGLVSAVIGTSGVVFAHSDRPVANEQGQLQSFCSAVEGGWSAFGCMLTAGGALEWLKGALYGSSVKFSQVLAEAKKSSSGSEGLFFLPYLDGERCPHPDPLARGAWVGLSRRHGRSELTRSVIEGVTYGMADQIQLMRKKGLVVSEVRCGGGGAQSVFWRQLQADIYGADTISMQTENASAFGAALLAGVGAEVWPSVTQACAQSVKTAGRLRPNLKSRTFYGQGHLIFRNLYVNLKPTYSELPQVTS